jgi:hypothetical protein
MRRAGYGFPRRPLLGSFVTKWADPDQKYNYPSWPLGAATNSSRNSYVSGLAPCAKTGLTRGGQVQGGVPASRLRDIFRSNGTRPIGVTPTRHLRTPQRGSSGSAPARGRGGRRGCGTRRTGVGGVESTRRTPLAGGRVRKRGPTTPIGPRHVPVQISWSRGYLSCSL